jgi:hypothetical protein
MIELYTYYLFYTYFIYTIVFICFFPIYFDKSSINA